MATAGAPGAGAAVAGASEPAAASVGAVDGSIRSAATSCGVFPAALVTETPADRSNSPPIMSSATAHAMMPMVELAYSTVASASGVRNGGATIAKKTKNSSELNSTVWSRRTGAAGLLVSRNPGERLSPHRGRLTWPPDRLISLDNPFGGCQEQCPKYHPRHRPHPKERA